MFRQVADLARLVCIGSLALAVYLLLTFALKAACQWIGQAPAAAFVEVGSPQDLLVIVDWDASVIRYVPWTGMRTSETMPATAMRREDLANLSREYVHPMEPAFRNMLLRDIDTGQLHAPSGIWCWTSVNGAAIEEVDGGRVIDAVFDDATEHAAKPLEENP